MKREKETKITNLLCFVKSVNFFRVFRTKLFFEYSIVRSFFSFQASFFSLVFLPNLVVVNIYKLNFSVRIIIVEVFDPIESWNKMFRSKSNCQKFWRKKEATPHSGTRFYTWIDCLVILKSNTIREGIGLICKQVVSSMQEKQIKTSFFCIQTLSYDEHLFSSFSTGLNRFEFKSVH